MELIKSCQWPRVLSADAGEQLCLSKGTEGPARLPGAEHLTDGWMDGGKDEQSLTHKCSD